MLFRSTREINRWLNYVPDDDIPNINAKEEKISNYSQWSTSDGIHYIPSSKTVEELKPGTYDIKLNNAHGIYFEKVPVVTTGLIRFPDTNSDKIVSEISKFWDNESIFREYNLVHKRGVMLYGPPGSGKSCTIQLVMQDVIERGGIVINFALPSVFLAGMRKFREIQPKTPIVILMEDIDSILENNSESDVLNILDGVNQIDKVVFLATTNYPERLGERIINRPSRFDKRFQIDHPSPESRKMYLEFIMGGVDKIEKLGVNLETWVEDTDNFSLAHMKELFVAVCILGDNYDDAIKTLKSMQDVDLSSKDFKPRGKMGF